MNPSPTSYAASSSHHAPQHRPYSTLVERIAAVQTKDPNASSLFVVALNPAALGSALGPADPHSLAYSRGLASMNNPNNNNNNSPGNSSNSNAQGISPTSGNCPSIGHSPASNSPSQNNMTNLPSTAPNSPHSASKIHCRPDCSAAPSAANPDDLIFFDTSELAVKAGFKPCLKCNPDLPVHVDSLIIQQTVNTVNASLKIDIRAPPATQPSGEVLHPTSEITVVKREPSALSNNNNSSTTVSSSASSFPAYADGTVSSPSLSPPSLSHPNPHHHFNAFSHSRTPSLATTPPDQIEQEFWNSRPRRASIANGHISVVAAAVDEISRAEGNGMPFGISTPTVPMTFSPTQKQFSNFSQQQLQHQLQQQIIQNNQLRPQSQNNKRRDDRVTKGEGEHARLVSEACMHIAAAAAAAAAQAAYEPEEPDSRRRNVSSSAIRASSQDPSRKSFKPQRKKRRGGILGFKELAAKAGLSPWHFHRVFRSVTGLTPKAYGDACWNTVTGISPGNLPENKSVSASSSPALGATFPANLKQQFQQDSMTQLPPQARPMSQKNDSMTSLQGYNMRFTREKSDSALNHRGAAPAAAAAATSATILSNHITASPVPTGLSTPNTAFSSDVQSNLGTRQTTPGSGGDADPVPPLITAPGSHPAVPQISSSQAQMLHQINAPVGNPRLMAQMANNSPMIPGSVPSSSGSFAQPVLIPSSSDHFNYVGNAVNTNDGSNLNTMEQAVPAGQAQLNTPAQQQFQYSQQKSGIPLNESWSFHNQPQPGADLFDNIKPWSQQPSNSNLPDLHELAQEQVDSILNSLEPDMYMMHIDSGMNTQLNQQFAQQQPQHNINPQQALQYPSLVYHHDKPTAVLPSNTGVPLSATGSTRSNNEGGDVNMTSYGLDFSAPVSMDGSSLLSYAPLHQTEQLDAVTLNSFAEFTNVSRPQSRLQAVSSRLEAPTFDGDLGTNNHSLDETIGMFGAPSSASMTPSGTNTPSGAAMVGMIPKSATPSSFGLMGQGDNNNQLFMSAPGIGFVGGNENEDPHGHNNDGNNNVGRMIGENPNQGAYPQDFGVADLANIHMPYAGGVDINMSSTTSFSNPQQQQQQQPQAQQQKQMAGHDPNTHFFMQPGSTQSSSSVGFITDPLAS